MPQLSSVITKIIAGDFKINHNLKVLSIEIWEASLLKYCSMLCGNTKKAKRILDLKTLKSLKAN